KLTHPGARHDYALDYSPDGSLIVFERDAPDYSRAGVWTMNPDGSGAARILNSSFYPSWSPVP
ncbi:MAG: Tol-Pal system protein TolB, partial [Actinomycetota bacterium]|nr:Tol-Pal system protein TolB [Actinomycetota bacterium]